MTESAVERELEQLQDALRNVEYHRVTDDDLESAALHHWLRSVLGFARPLLFALNIALAVVMATILKATSFATLAARRTRATRGGNGGGNGGGADNGGSGSDDSTEAPHAQSIKQSATNKSHATSLRERRILLVIAHPDDESMFLAPTIAALTARGATLRVLCLSSGNFYGLGKTRINELSKALNKMGVSSHSVIEDEQLQDGSTEKWPSQLIARIVTREIKDNAIDCVLTFDKRGVSGHFDHIATCDGVREAARRIHEDVPRGAKDTKDACTDDNGNAGNSRSLRAGSRAAARDNAPTAPVSFYTLRSLRVLPVKYAGLLGAALTLFFESTPTATNAGDKGEHRSGGGGGGDAHTPLAADDPLRLVFFTFTPMVAIRGMLAHQSQLVWFRWLSVVFSTYSYVNVLDALEINASTTRATSKKQQ